MNYRLLSVVILTGLTVFEASPASAQITAGIRGAVSDESGGAVPNATVTATNTGTSLSVSGVSGADGTYTIAQLPIGEYKLIVTAAGFKKYEQPNITLTTNQVAGINVTLAVGAVTESIAVTAGAPLVNTQTTEVGQTIGSQQIVDLPLNGRNAIQLATLVNGVSGERVTTALVGTDERDASRLSVNGNRYKMTQFNLDGGEFAGMRMNSGLNYPNPDAIAEFRFMTNNYSAEFGKNPGGVMNVVTKSGTNDFHGSAWEFNRNSAFAARSFFLPTVAPLNQNQFGFSGGGPVVRNKLFFFGTAQWLKIRQGRATTTLMPPTALERQGDFSGRAAIRDPLTGQPFPGNVIPRDRLDPVAMGLVALSAPPNSPDGRFLGAFAEPVNNHQYLLKGDYNISERSRLTMSWYEDKTLSTSLLDFGRLDQPITGATGPPYKKSDVGIRNAIGSHTLTLRPNLINQFRFGYVEVKWDVSNEGRGPNLIDLGSQFPQQRFLDVPTISVPGRMRFFGGNNVISTSNDYQFSDTVNYIVGRHNIRIGGEFRFTQLVSLSSGNAHGALLASGVITGNALADFMLGRVNMFVSNPLGGDYRQKYGAGFIQDDFKIRRNLVLNLGLRYQVSTPWTAISDVPLMGGGTIAPVATFVPGQQSTVFRNAPTGLVYPGDAGIPSGAVHMDKNDWSPRIGLAWDLFGTGRTSIRAAYGLFYGTPNGDMTTPVSYSAPFFINFNVPDTPSFVEPIPASLRTAFPVPTGRDMSFRPYQPLTIQGIDPHLRNPEVHQFNFFIQQQLPGRVSLQAGWVGNTSTHLEFYSAINPAMYIPGNDAAGNPLSTVANTNARRRLNLQYPPAPGEPLRFGAVSLGQSRANSNYHSLQVEGRKSFAHGVNVLTSYTFSKAIDVASILLSNGLATDVPQNPEDIAGSRGLASFDQRHRMVTSLIYNVPSLSRPLGLGKNPFFNRLLDAWDLGTIVQLNSGSPFNIVSGVDNSRTAYGADRPNLVGDPFLPSDRPRSQLINAYFNGSAFVQNSVGAFGNFGRNVLIGPGRANVDFTVNKNFPISERLGRVQIRFEFFNLLNRPNFGAPGSSMAAPAQFGKILSADSGRIIQFGAKYNF